jgi:hypothetical protein
MDLTAVGVPVTDVAEGWNFWPLIGVPVALLVAFRWLRLPRSASVAIGAVLAGVLTADAIGAWGVVPVAAALAIATIGASIVLGRLRREHPPTV